MRNTTIKFCSLMLVKENTVKYNKVISNKNDVGEFIKDYLKGRAIERFLVIGLNTANKIVVAHYVDGAVDSCAVPVSTILKILLLSNATQVIIAHNHPGESVNFSKLDIDLTKKIKDGCKAVDLSLLDHVLVHGDNITSIRSQSNILGD